MKNFIQFTFTLLLSNFFLTSAARADIGLDLNLLTAAEFAPRNDHLVMNLNLKAVSSLIEKIERSEGLELKSRNEVHVTALTPIEYGKVQSHISIGQINQIAKNLRIQNSKIELRCLGVGRKAQMKTFYIVLASDSLLKIRKEIHAQFVRQGGEPNDFEPTRFYPHITLAFSHRDLHESDAVVKDEKSCFERVHAY
jgi:2'-5' RNA ligase